MPSKNYLNIRRGFCGKRWLPTPENYFQEQFPDLKLSDREWISVRCCFHQDTNPSLRINLHSGRFRCFACGVKGSNIIVFHSCRYGLSLPEAAIVLEGRV